MNSWYKQLQKPSWAPPPWIFGPVWTLLYIVIAITFGSVVFKFAKSQIPFQVLLPFLLNIVFNIAFTPLQFSLRSNKLALLDILLVLLTLGWALIAIYSYAELIALANIPYLLWVSFATALQITITWMNRGQQGIIKGIKNDI